MAFSVAFSQALEITAYVNAKSQAQHEDYLSIQKISEMLTFRFLALKKFRPHLKKVVF